jgi:hypothetical protein
VGITCRLQDCVVLLEEMDKVALLDRTKVKKLSHQPKGMKHVDHDSFNL